MEVPEQNNQNIDADLGRANLLRMRGEYKEAAELCLAILRKSPNNVTAHSLLGDIYYDQDDLKHAAEWYELASDLDPNATREKQLLERIRQRLQESEHLQTLEQLGVDSKAPPVTRYVVAGALTILAFGIVGFFLGQNVRQRPETPPGISQPITVPPTQTHTPTENPTASPVNPPEFQNPANDIAALATLKQGPKGHLVLSCIELPDRQSLVVTARAESEEPTALTALLVAADVFVLRPTTRSTSVRIVHEEKIIFSGEITREAYDQAQSLSTAEGADLEAIATQAFPGATIDDGRTPNVTPRSDQDAEQSSGSGQGQY